MRHYRTESEPREVLDHADCDICGRNVEHGCDSMFDVQEVTIRASIGKSYPECTSLEVYEPDICPDCFYEKVVPLLEGLGVKVKKKDVFV